MNLGKVIMTLVIALIVWILFISVAIVYGAENKPVSQSTSRENQIRRQMFNTCIANGNTRAYCYRLYY